MNYSFARDCRMTICKLPAYSPPTDENVRYVKVLKKCCKHYLLNVAVFFAIWSRQVLQVTSLVQSMTAITNHDGTLPFKSCS